MIIGPGSPVIFIGPDPLHTSGLTVDALYFVEEVFHCTCDQNCGDAYSLRGRPGYWDLYPAICFRPLADDGDEAKTIAVKDLVSV